MTQRFVIHNTVVDIEARIPEPLKTYFTQNPIPESSIFEVPCGGKTFLFRLSQHFVTNEKLSVMEFLEEKT